MAADDFIEFELPSLREITDDGKRMLLEQQVKHNGIWRIHKSDPDNIFPSDPHADRTDEPEKLNLYTGDVYSKTNKSHLYTLPKKAMKYIYNQIIRGGEQNIIDKLNANRELINYL